MLKKSIIIITLLLSSLYAKQINIAAASNVTFAMPSLIKKFNEQYPKIKINITIGSSGKLTALIKNGASYDIFMSANMKYPNALFKENLTVAKPLVYAKGKLALLSSKKIDFQKSLEILKDKNIKKIAIANPKTAPYGKASVEAMKNAKIYDEVEGKLLFAQNISQTVTYILNGVDVGFIAKSSLYSPKLKAYEKFFVDVDEKLYTPINQGIVVLKNSKNQEEAMKFYNFIFSSKSKEIFKNFGYEVK